MAGRAAILQRDLPFELPVTAAVIAAGMDRVQQGVYKAHFACFATFNTGAVSVWAWSGGHEFWPAFTLIPGGALLAWHRRGSQRLHRKRDRGHRCARRLDDRRGRQRARPRRAARRAASTERATGARFST